jgi:catechol 2,3-dioxygenase-like lactoylglutathione lyase family enzyme
MAQIRHIAISSDHPGKTAEFFKKAFGMREVHRHGLDPNNPEVAPRPSSVVLTDGYISMAILKLAKDQTGVGLDYQGLHHIGFVVSNDIDGWTKHLEALGAPNITTPEEMPKNAHWEIKFRAPDDVVFDISHSTWPGAAPVDPATTPIPVKEAAE